MGAEAFEIRFSSFVSRWSLLPARAGTPCSDSAGHPHLREPGPDGGNRGQTEGTGARRDIAVSWFVGLSKRPSGLKNDVRS